MEQRVKITDEEVVSTIEAGIAASVGDFLNSSDLSQERQKSTFEYGMIPKGHLAPQGVSQIVSSDTVEAVEGYLAVISELMLNNNKLARFKPAKVSPTAISQARAASELTNYVIFKQNPGWETLNSWVKGALLWKNSIVRWDYIEDHDYKFDEYDEIDQNKLDLLLSDPEAELAAGLEFEPQMRDLPDGDKEIVNIYKNVRIRKKTNKSRVCIKNVPPESFRITRDASSIDDAAFVGIQIDMTRSEIRKHFPDMAESIDWDNIGDGSSSWATKYNEEQASRKDLVGQEYWMGGNSKEIFPLEANQVVTVVECWIRIDRDNDGIAELKHFITAGSTILLEEDCDYIPLASLCPFEVPHEFYGLSISDMIRPSTLATSAILRGFVENVYLTNYSPKLADPNVVDFSALQNMKPKQLIATNGNPNAAVASLTPDTISQGTVPLLEMLQMHKEQATGLSKAAQGLNDTLYVSGNSEEKMQRAMSAAQIRVQYMARRFAETGFKRLVEGVYRMMRQKMAGVKVNYYDNNNFLKSIDPADLPDDMILFIDADVGEHANSNIIKKMSLIGKELIPALQAAGAGNAIKPEAALNIAAQTLEAMDVDPLDFLEDHTTPEYQKKAEASREQEMKSMAKLKEMEEKLKDLDIKARESNIALTNIQSKNAMQDNTRQMMIALDKHYQEWAKMTISAAKEGIDPSLVPPPNIEQLYKLALQAIGPSDVDASLPEMAPKGESTTGIPVVNPGQPMI
jgi:hypothetical protein